MAGEEAVYYQAVGRRKRAVARVKMSSGKGEIKVNQKDIKEYFPTENLVRMAEKPFVLTNTVGKYDIKGILNGGGLNGQAGALSMSISRALIKFEPSLRTTLKRAGLLRRDPREKERKKYGQRGARRRFQFSKR